MSALRTVERTRTLAVRQSAQRWEPAGDVQAAFGRRGALREDGSTRGVHAAWSWDGAGVTVETSRFGMIPVYFHATARTFCVSTSVLDVVRACGDATPDDDAIALFLRLGFFVGDDTPFRAVRAVPMNATLRWAEGRLEVRARTEAVPKAASAARSALVDGYVDVVRTAVRRLAPRGPVTLPLSGGRDSRHLLLELLAAGTPPACCVTSAFYPTRSEEDLRVARGLCWRAGLPHVAVPQRWDWTRAATAKNLATGFCADEHGWALPLAAWLDANAVTVLDGIAADVLSRDVCTTPARLAACRRGALGELAADVVGGREESLDHWLSPEARRRFPLERALARFVDAARPYAGWPNPVATCFLVHRTRREIALMPWQLYGAKAEVLAPYMDDDVLDFLLALPGELLLDKRMHDDAIARGHPKWAGLPYGRNDWDDDAARWPPLARRAWFARVGVDLASTLAVHRSAWIQRGFVVPRLAYLLVDGTADRVWFDLDRVHWLAQLERWIGGVEAACAGAGGRGDPTDGRRRSAARGAS